jgi:prepilin peptidase CpaA
MDLFPDGTLAFCVRAALIALLLIAAVSDAHTRRIPNRLTASVALLALLLVLADGRMHLLTAIATAALVLCLMFGAFALRLLGGGDAKLIAAVTLACATPPGALRFLFLTAAAGGFLALFWLVWRRRSGADPRLPYGIAIAAGGIPALLLAPV